MKLSINGYNVKDHISVFQETINSLDGNSSDGVKHIYNIGSLQGFAGRFGSKVLEEIRKNPIVDYVERDQAVHLADTQHGAPWGLARISHRKTLTSKTISKYEHNSNGGDGITIFIIDTGINIHHEDIKGRVVWGINTIDDDDTDGHGHGSYVSSIAGGTQFGVAKKVNFVAVKVVDARGESQISQVINGVNFALNGHLSMKDKQGSRYRGSVVNISLGTPKSRAWDSSLENSIAQGLHFAVAAGNENQDACNTSPAGVKDAITVAASDVKDRKAHFSNYGPCVDIFAPGVDVEGAWFGSDNTTFVASGTSASSPFVAGYMAYYLSLIPDSNSAFHSGPISPKEMKDVVINQATRDVLKGIDPETPNMLLYNNHANTYSAW
ncbi:serine protease [Entomortierella beljakovae]|nr:serine protease [Entomortierella beljakovae]